MTRTTWFALSCLVGLAAVAAIRVGMPGSAPPVAEQPEQQAAAEDAVALNRGTKSDRLPLSEAQQAALAPASPEVADASPAETPVATMDLLAKPDSPPAPPPVAQADEAPSRPAAPRSRHRRWQDANAKLVTTSARHRHARHAQPRTEAANDASKATVAAVPCRQDAVSGLLRALDLSPRCGS